MSDHSTAEGRTYVGRPMRRREDAALLVGAGRYVDDISVPDLLHMALVRSPHAHARVRAVSVDAARRLPGVVTVVTARDLGEIGPMSVNRMFPKMRVPLHPILSAERVRSQGEALAAVVAESAAAATDGAAAVVVDYEPLSGVASPADARAGGAPDVFDDVPGNVSFTGTFRAGNPEAVLTAAARVVKVSLIQPRVAAVAMEPRAVLAIWDRVGEQLTVWTAGQAPFRTRAEIARMLELSEARVRVIAPDVGGGFGVKTGPYREEILVAWLTRHLGRPVKWTSTRTEDLLSTQHGRGAHGEGELGVSADGRITGLRARIVYPLGSSLTFTTGGPARNHARCLPGPYEIEHVDIQASGVITTTPPTGPYRGAGRPEAAFLMERLVDEAARALAIDAVEFRRRNLIPAGKFPFTTATGQSYDSGDYQRLLEETLRIADYDGLRRQQVARRANGEIVGVGVAMYVEPSALGWESGLVRVERTGAVTVVTGSSAHGQGHETTFAQIVADHLGVPPESIVVRHGDTLGAPQGFGTFGSRSTALGGGALVLAARDVREKGRRIAAYLLEAGVADVETVFGGFQVVGAPQRVVGWRQVAAVAYGPPSASVGEPGLEATRFFQPEAEVWSAGAVIAAARIERDTGRIVLERLAWVDDAGTIVNPLLAEGQLHGSLAQAWGQIMGEEVVFDRDGHLLTGTLMDYPVPRADEVPHAEIGHGHTPSPRNPLGAKGLGEAGTIGIPPALVNAVVDALAPCGVRHVDMPLTPEKIWRAIRSGASGSSRAAAGS
jgi:aerobic carbon-monoxide dehydrogenase large subunit